MKRFTDTELWKKPWFMEMTPAEKLAWYYITIECDNVGVWTPNFRLAEFMIGTQLDWDKFKEKCNDNIHVLEDGKWFLIDFVRFQHSDLFNGSTSNACKSYVLLLKKHGVYYLFPELFEAFGKPSPSLREGYKERVREKEQVKVKVKEEDSKLFHAIEQSFLSQLQDETQYSYGKERKHIKKLIERIHNKDSPEEFIKKVIETFHRLKNGRDKFWNKQPFLPSVLNSDSMWPRVVEEMQDNYINTGVELWN